jgi:predicted  nucleic acid-binding Zn-ribbon protein
MMPDLSCRVAKLEEQVKTLYDNSTERRRQADRTNELLEEIRNSLQSEITALKEEISEIKGFGNGLKAGAMMMIGLLSSGITVVIDRIFSH